MASGVIEIEHGYSTARQAGAIHPPKTGPAITEPDHLGGALKRLLGRFELELGNKLVNIAQYGY